MEFGEGYPIPPYVFAGVRKCMRIVGVADRPFMGMRKPLNLRGLRVIVIRKIFGQGMVHERIERALV
jgi:hypothetical protein